MHFYIKVSRLIPQQNAISINTLLKEHIKHVSVQAYHLQGEQNVSLKKRLPLESCYLWGSSVCSSFVVDVKYKLYNGTNFVHIFGTSCTFRFLLKILWPIF